MNISYYGIRPNISQAYISYASQSTAHKLLNTVIILVRSYTTFPRNYKQSWSTRSKDYCQAITVHTHDTECLDKRTVFLYIYSTAINLTNSEHGVTESASKVAVTMVELHSCPRQEEDTTKILGANSYTSGKYRHIWQII